MTELHRIQASDQYEDIALAVEEAQGEVWLTMLTDHELETLHIYQDSPVRDGWDEGAPFLVLIGIDLESNNAYFVRVEISEDGWLDAGRGTGDNLESFPISYLINMAHGVLEY